MHKDVERVLFSNEEIVKKCDELGKEITAHFEGRNPIVVGLLKGSIPFMAELVKHIECDMEMDFMEIASYSGTSSTEVRVLKDIAQTVSNRPVLIVEDIVDTGKTLAKVKEMFKNKGASEVKIVTLFDKKEGRLVEMDVDWYGYDVPNEFIIGFGLDYNQKYRNLPYVGVIKKDAI